MSSTAQRFATIVTGAGSGIGWHSALEMAKRGSDVVLWDVDTGALDRLEQEIRLAAAHVRVTSTRVDVSDHEACLQAAEAARSNGFDIKHVIASAGIVRFNSLLNENRADANLVFQVNYFGVVNTMEAFHADLVKNRGSAVLIGSTESYSGGAPLHAYASSKHAVLGYGRSTAMELGPHGVRVNTICPGIVRTGMYNEDDMGPEAQEMNKAMQARIPLRRICEPQEIAKTAAFLLSDDASYITGASIVADGGMTV